MCFQYLSCWRIVPKSELTDHHQPNSLKYPPLFQITRNNGGNITSASPAGHGGATGRRTTQGDRGGRGDCCSHRILHLRIHCYNAVFSGQEGVCRVLGGMLQHIYRSGPRLLRPLPGQSALCHHVASFLATSTVAYPRNFGTTNYVTRTHKQAS